MSDINKFVEKQSNVPFTMRNIYKIIEIIIGTHQGRMDRVVEEAFDLITKHHNENRFAVEGWKTNDMFMVNKKFIINYYKNYYSFNSNKVDIDYKENRFDDITKALCYLTHKNYDDIGCIRNHVNYSRDRNAGYNFGEWIEWGFFKMKFYKKGSAHVQFLDEDVWARFNQVACKAKGWMIPETTKHKSKK